MTKDFSTIKDASTCLILIQGKGDGVRAGLWARSVCINDTFERGTMLPFIERALLANIPILIMNPNQHIDPESGLPAPESDTNPNHCLNVWE